MTESLKVKKVVLANYSRKDEINIAHIEKPYGEFSNPVVRIDRIESGEKTGIIEIPYENLDEVIEALYKAELISESIPRNDIHGELKSGVGGGA